jgi:adenylate cyclase
MRNFEFIIYSGSENSERFSCDGPIDVGRQNVNEPAPPTLFQPSQGRKKLVIAPFSRREIPRIFFKLEAGVGGTFSVHNLHKRIPINIKDSSGILPGEERVLPSGAVIDLGPTLALQLGGQQMSAPPFDDDAKYRSLAHVPPAPKSFAAQKDLTGYDVTMRDFVPGSDTATHGTAIVQLLQLALSVIQQATGSDAFYEAAARAAGKIVELDRAKVLLFEDGVWTDRAIWQRRTVRSSFSGSMSQSSTLLNKLLEQKRTQIFNGTAEVSDVASLASLDRAVASPILDENQEVIGALYGDRRSSAIAEEDAITDIEATLVEVIAGAVAAALAIEREERSRQQMSQHFSPRVADALLHSPELLEGQDAEVTVLFCDIRGFSTVTERLGPRSTLLWINDVLTELSECVLRQDGVLVDYVGDELLAMFGVPFSQPDHAERAIAAAQEMLACAAPLQEKWYEELQTQMGFGIGISTGPARVGNTGSRVKFKYGPLGNTVNMGSRIQGATKFFDVTALASEATLQAFETPPKNRRLGATRLKGIVGGVVLYEIANNPSADWEELKLQYEAALLNFEQGNYSACHEQAAALNSQFPQDRISARLLDRVRKQLAEPETPADPIWELTSK